MLLENGADRLVPHRVATNHPFVKSTISSKYNKTRHMQMSPKGLGKEKAPLFSSIKTIYLDLCSCTQMFSFQQKITRHT